MTILSANEARESSNKNLNECITSELMNIMDMIKHAIEEGKFQIHLSDISLKPETKSRLIELGYKLDIGGRLNENYVWIKW